MEKACTPSLTDGIKSISESLQQRIQLFPDDKQVKQFSTAWFGLSTFSVLLLFCL